MAFLNKNNENDFEKGRKDSRQRQSNLKMVEKSFASPKRF